MSSYASSEGSGSKRLVGRMAWWIGVPILVFIADVAPFIFIRCVQYLHVYEPCWRLPVLGPIIFDGYLYMEFMGMAASVLDGGYHLGWFAAVIRALHLLLPFLSNVEFWLFLTWLFGVLSWWTAAWALKAFAPLSVWWRRLSASVLWIAVFLTLGFRPGVFSWFLPFGFFMLVACVRIVESLRERHWYRAAAWSLAAFFVSTVYSWFLIFAALWIGSSWALAVLSKLSRSRLVIFWAGLTVLDIVAVVVALLFFPQRVLLTLQILLRNGMSFTHMLLISNLLVAAIMWAAIMLIIARRRGRLGETDSVDEVLAFAWIITILVWSSSVMTGLYLHNDHFRIFVLIFAWITCTILVERRIKNPTTCVENHLRMWLWPLLAAAASLYYLSKPYALDNDQLNTIHLAVWLGSGVSLGLVLGRFQISARKAALTFIGVALLVGLPQYFRMFFLEARRTPQLASFQPMVSWIRSHASSTERLCATPEQAEFIGANTGRSTFFSWADALGRTSDTELAARLSVYASVVPISPQAAGFIKEYVVNSRGVACHQFGSQRRLLSRWLSEEQLDSVLGCPRADMRRDEIFIDSLSRQSGKNDPAFSLLCPWVIVPRDATEAWRIPNSFKLLYEDMAVKIYHAPVSP